MHSKCKSYESGTFPRMFKFSSRNFEARMAETRILRAPNDVTNEAGAKA